MSASRIALAATIAILSTGLAAVPFFVARDATSHVVMAPAGAPGIPSSSASRDQIEGIVRSYLIANPEILREMANALQTKDQAEQREQAARALAELGDGLFSSGDQIVLGNPEGDVTLVEFFDYNCGFCRQVRPEIAALIERDPNLRVVLKEFPVLGEESVQAARVSVAVHRLLPGRYMDFHNSLMTMQGRVDGDAALALAEEYGLDAGAIMADVTEAANEAYLRDSHELARKLGIDGTPAFIIGGEVIPGAQSLDRLAQLVTNTRACGQATC